MRIATLLVLCLPCLQCLAQEPIAKAKLPEETAQKASLALVADVYKSDYEKAKTPAQKIELAKKLLGEGVATKNDPVSRFVLFRVARDIAARQGDLATAFIAVTQIGTEFDIDQLQMQVDAATTAAKALRTPQEHEVCASILAPLVDEAIAADRYEHAKSLANLMLVCAREMKDSSLVKQMIAKSKEIDEITAEFEKLNEAKVLLKTMPTDPDANNTVGRFLCFAKGDWRRGVSMLAFANDIDCKSAALLELETQPDSLQVGDAWWKVAENVEGAAKSRIQGHAIEWYRKALPGLSGLTKARVERLVAQTQPTATAKEARPAKNGESTGKTAGASKPSKDDAAAASRKHLAVGTWRTPGGNIILIDEDGSLAAASGGKGKWLPRGLRAFDISWESGDVA